ncbi:MAG: class I SAM-dependent methyltransferase [Acidobacteriota bacterium]|nr:class I SAM-dependent methyltransferase [Acidobacteriota bacterium]MDH3786369.1 class I SAM-dependent methyltransferase [Acidobacteriota bacterium]
MTWGPRDWDAWTASTECTPRSDVSQHVDVARFVLDNLPDRDTMSVVDLGCGAGRDLPFLAARFADVTAVDFAPESLAEARKACVDLPVSFRRRDLRDLAPFRNRFDVAWAMDSILGPGLREFDRVVSQAYRTLREGGLLVASFPASPRGEGVPRPFRLDDGDETTADVLCHHEAELQYRLARAGFQGVRVRRLAGVESDTLLAIATRRALN